MRILAGIAFLIVTSLSAAAGAQRATPAQRHYAAGDAHFQNGRFQDAATEFQAAYDISHNAAVLYNVARSLGNAGNVNAAIETYQRFLDAGSPGVDRQEVVDAIRALESRRSNALPTTVEVRPPAPPPTVVTPPVPVPPVGPANTLAVTAGPRAGVPPIITPVRPAPEMSALNRFGPWVTMGVGAILAGVSIQQGLAAAEHRSTAAEAASGQRPFTLEVQDANGSFEGEATRAIALGVAGGAAITAGVLWLALRHNPRTERPPPVQPLIGLNQLGVAGTF